MADDLIQSFHKSTPCWDPECSAFPRENVKIWQRKKLDSRWQRNMYGNGDTRRKLYPGLRAFIFFPRADLSPLPTLLQIALPSIVSRVQQDWNKFENFHLFFTSANEILTIVVCGKQVFCFFFFPPPFVTKQLRSRLNWIHRWWRDWNWNNSNTTRIPLIPLGGNQKMESLETKYGSVLLSRIIDEREKKKRASRKNLLEGRGRMQHGIIRWWNSREN